LEGKIELVQEYKVRLEDYIVQAEGNIVSDMDGEKVMLSIKNGKYYNLGIIGGAIWDYIKSPLQVEELITKLQSEFIVEKEQCEADVLPFIEHLFEEELVLLLDEEQIK